MDIICFTTTIDFYLKNSVSNKLLFPKYLFKTMNHMVVAYNDNYFI